MIFLQSHGVSTSLAVKIYKQYGDGAVGVLKTDPYRLQRDIYGIGFLTADKIAQAMGIPHDSPERVAAGVAYVLGQQSDDGHVYTPRPDLLTEAAPLLGVEEPLVEQAIVRLQQDEQVHVEAVHYQMQPSGERVGRSPGRLSHAFLLRRDRRGRSFAQAERGASGLWLHEIARVYPVRLGHRLCGAATANRHQLADAQRQAVQTALTNPVTVLTGGPGTGKTTTLRSIIRLLQAAGNRFALAAPTGRAAKRMAEAAGHEAKTIHRLLEVSPSEGFSLQAGCRKSPGHRHADRR